MEFQVRYKLQENAHIKQETIFQWLHIPQPHLLQKGNKAQNINVKGLYIQRGSSRRFDDIVEVQRILSDYEPCTDIFILALSTIDGEKRHMHECTTSQKITKGRTTFIEIHCSYDDKIYNCTGNNETKDFLCPELISTELKGYGHTANSPVKKVTNAKEICTTISTWIRRFLNWIPIRPLILYVIGLFVLVLYLYY